MPKEYDSLIMAIERDMNQGVDPTLERVKADVREMYTLNCKNSGFDPDHEEYTQALTGYQKKFKKQFKGLCRVCGKRGHKGTYCLTLEKNKSVSYLNWVEFFWWWTTSLNLLSATY